MVSFAELYACYFLPLSVADEMSDSILGPVPIMLPTLSLVSQI